MRQRRQTSCELFLLCALAVLCIAAQPAHAEPLDQVVRPPAPWPRRERQGIVLEPVQRPFAPPTPIEPPHHNLTLQEARRLGIRPLPRRSAQVSAWPPEPLSPPSVDLARFTSALVQLCATPHVERIAEAVVTAASAYGVDPFLLAAVAHQQSECRPDRADAYGVGLTRINPGMYRRDMRAGAYHYKKPDRSGHFVDATLSVPRYPFSPAALRNPAVNTYFAAALLSMYEQQCSAIDPWFGSVPHRHHVSHFIFGDRVRSSLPEDEILIARRRLLFYYAPYCESPNAEVGGIELSSPLDSPPRLVIGVIGEPRDNGKRIHLGIDLGASEGEPVRAMAAGVVTFAGVDLRAQGLVQMPSKAAEQVLPGAMGPRGLFVRVDHGAGIETLYVHLANYDVRAGDPVERGQHLGVVGRSGVHASDAHLHLGVFVDKQPIDPLPPLQPYLVRARTVEDAETPTDPAPVHIGR